MKTRSPILCALLILTYVWGGFVSFFVLGNVAIAFIWGAEAEMNWPFSFLLFLIFPIFFVGGGVAAADRFNRERDRQTLAQKEDQH